MPPTAQAVADMWKVATWVSRARRWQKNGLKGIEALPKRRSKQLELGECAILWS